MKKTLTTWIIIAMSFIACQSWAQIAPTYTLTIKNITYKTDTALEFDVYIQHTNPLATNFEYAAGQYFIFFNTAILNGGTGRYSIVSSGLPTNMQPRSPSVAANVLRLAANVPPGAGLGFPMPSTPVLIVKMRLKNIAGTLNTAVTPDLVWKDAPQAPPVTTINAYIGVTNTAITTPATHTVSAFSILNLTALIEGRYNVATDAMIGDNATVYLHNATAPYAIVDSSSAFLNSTGKGVFNFANASTGSYYIVVKHKNSIETWSSSPQNFVANSSNAYDFSSDASKAYQNNLVQKGTKWCIYSGDINQDGIVDLSDLATVDNDVYTWATGNVLTDITGDLVVDVNDLQIADNNAYNYVLRTRP